MRWTVRDRDIEHAPLGVLEISEASRMEALMRRAEAQAFAFSDQDVLSGLLPPGITGCTYADKGAAAADAPITTIC